MVLSDRDILRFQKGDTPLISPFDLSRLRSASYDVTIDDEVTVLSEAVGVVKLSDQDEVEQVHTINHSIEGFVLFSALAPLGLLLTKMYFRAILGAFTPR